MSSFRTGRRSRRIDRFPPAFPPSCDARDPVRAAERPVARWGRLALAVGIVLIVGWTMRHKLPAFGPTWATLRRAEPWWLIAAIVEAASMAAFAEQQRQLLTAFGVRMSPWR